MNKTIPFLKENFSDREILICREMTKIYEEYLRYKIDDLKTLDENNKLIVRQYDCKHEDFKMPSCFLDSNLSASEISLLKLTISYL